MLMPILETQRFLARASCFPTQGHVSYQIGCQEGIFCFSYTCMDCGVFTFL